MSTSTTDSIKPRPSLYPNLPGVPDVPLQGLETLFRLLLRQVQTQSAKNGLTDVYKIGDTRATAHSYLFGGAEDADFSAVREAVTELVAARFAPSVPVATLSKAAQQAMPQASPSDLTRLSLDDPAQFAMAWTSYYDIRQDAQPLLAEWSATLTDAAVATKNFWPVLTQHGLPYNLLFLEKVTNDNLASARKALGNAWTPARQAQAEGGSLYLIDLTLFATLQPQQDNGVTRFTPATLVLLEQDASTKALAPVAIAVTGYQGAGGQSYSYGACTEAAWLYALQAAKASATLYGIWLGHVYQWHIVTAAMFMTMLNNVPSGSALYELLKPQSDYLMGFNQVLLDLWAKIAPPTSIATADQFLSLGNAFAAGRGYFDDDPPTALARLGLEESAFSAAAPWDQYPLVGLLLEGWAATDRYVKAFVETTYPTDAAVAADAALQAWMTAAADPAQGNIRGLPTVNTKSTLQQVLTSLIFRVTIHGSSRAFTTANPGLTFVANFPPCLMDATIPEPTANFDTRRLLQYLPDTGTIGRMMTFYNTFGFSVPYKPFVPLAGAETELFFPGGTADPRNAALVAYRQEVTALAAKLYAPHATQVSQWPLNIET